MNSNNDRLENKTIELEKLIISLNWDLIKIIIIMFIMIIG